MLNRPISFPRSAWECRLDALRPPATQSVWQGIPRRAWKETYLQLATYLLATLL